MRTREKVRGKVTTDINQKLDINQELELLNLRLKTLEKSLTIIAQELDERINEIEQRFDKQDRQT